jgi:polyisoprenoid-binding protein YceI
MNGMLVAHLKSPDFFDTEKWPDATLQIESVSPIDAPSDGLPNFQITADLTLLGITHPVEFSCLAGRNDEGDFIAQAQLDIDRTHWGVRYGSGRFFEWLGMHLVSDLISLQIKMTASGKILAEG